MAAYAAVIILQQTLQNMLQHSDKFSIPCEKKDIESFHEKFEFLQQFLEEYPSQKSDEKVKSLERRIGDAAYEAEDFIEDLHLKNQPDSKYLRLLPPFQNDKSLFFKLIAEVDSIIREVIKIKEQMEIKQMEEEIKTGKFGKHRDFEPRNALHKDPSQLVSSDRMNSMEGFDHHLLQIKDQLTDQSSALTIISIVGMGGIGKTTLATCAHNDPSVVYKFDVRAWATISQSYSIRDILLGMLDSMKILTQEMYCESDDRLRLLVYQNLKGRRYLITIDDIWDTNAWDDLKMMFPDDGTESRIMLTTRIADVAAYASPSGTLHQVSLLSDDQSWKLLCSKVFGDETCPLDLKNIGKSIAENCRGLPLSIVVIGGLLSKVKKTKAAWQSVADNVTSLVFSSEDRCSDILRLSYNNLPQYLKACFLYMGIFPKNYEIRVSQIVQLWIAEGFLRQAPGQSREELAERCVENLLDRSLILMSKKNYEGKINSFRIHDLLLDFCVKEAKDEEFLQRAHTTTNIFRRTSASERQISIRRSLFDSMSSTSYARLLFVLKPCSDCTIMLLRFKRLRVLDATKLKTLSKFPPQVLELLSLRYLALPFYGDIPASITKLWNLQTLIISGNSGGHSKSCLPVEIWMMVHLRHVRFDRAHLLDPRAAKFKLHKKQIILEDLQTLSGILNLKFSKEMVQSIPNIRKIDVSYNALGLQGKKWSYYQFENIGNLHHLKALKIRASPDLLGSLNLNTPSFQFPRASPDLLGSLNLNPPSFQFPQSLKTLTLVGVGIPWHDLAIIGSLPNLEVLKLKNDACVGTKWEPNEEEFPELKVLVLEELGLKHWKADSNHFPSLERLIIRGCSSLVEIPSGMGESPTLTVIELYDCQATVLASAKEILEKQLSYGNDGFQVKGDKAGIDRKADKFIKRFKEFALRRQEDEEYCCSRVRGKGSPTVGAKTAPCAVQERIPYCGAKTPPYAVRKRISYCGGENSTVCRAGKDPLPWGDPLQWDDPLPWGENSTVCHAGKDPLLWGRKQHHVPCMQNVLLCLLIFFTFIFLLTFNFNWAKT